MADKPKTREELIAEWVAKEAERQRKERRARRLPQETGGLSINSLMDAMTIILIFLLINFSVDPLRIEAGEDLKLPASTTEMSPEQSLAVTITASEIIVNDERVVRVKDGQVDKAFKQGDENSLRIQPLFEVLSAAAQKQKRIQNLRGAKFDGLLTVIAHREIPYRLLTEVLYTAGQAEFQRFKFAVLKGGQRG